MHIACRFMARSEARFATREWLVERYDFTTVIPLSIFRSVFAFENSCLCPAFLLLPYSLCRMKKARPSADPYIFTFVS